MVAYNASETILLLFYVLNATFRKLEYFRQYGTNSDLGLLVIFMLNYFLVRVTSQKMFLLDLLFWGAFLSFSNYSNCLIGKLPSDVARLRVFVSRIWEWFISHACTHSALHKRVKSREGYSSWWLSLCHFHWVLMNVFRISPPLRRTQGTPLKTFIFSCTLLIRPATLFLLQSLSYKHCKS